MENRNLILKIFNDFNPSLDLIEISPLSGGCISKAYRVLDHFKNPYFIKVNANPTEEFFIESKGLQLISQSFRVPKVLYKSERSLILEFIEPGEANEKTFFNFGKNLGGLHKQTNDFFGLHFDNVIGSTLQINTPIKNNSKYSWGEFFFKNRIFYLLDLLKRNNKPIKDFEYKIKANKNSIIECLSESSEKPSLIHGDLWSGNYLIDKEGTVVLIDASPYFGHREMEFSLNQLFGGFPTEFFQGYNSFFPLEKGHEKRINIYKLYHLLNHFLLFGGNYDQQALVVLDECAVPY